MMPRFCAAYGCSNSGTKPECKEKQISFHQFPLKDQNLLERWVANIKRDNFKPNMNSVLCSEHFEETEFIYQPFTNRRGLKKGAVPTIFSFKAPNKRKRTSYEFGFPKDEELRRLWEINLRRKNFKVTDATKICSEHFTEDCFDKSKLGGTWLKSSAVPTIFNFSNHYEKTKKKLKPTSRDQSSRIKVIIPGENSSDSASENTDSIRKVPNEKEIKFNKIHSKISFIQRPNDYWGVAATNKFIIFSKWNDEYIPEKRVVIEHHLNVKVFIGDLEINTFNLMELNSHFDVSDLLEKVDAINFK